MHCYMNPPKNGWEDEEDDAWCVDRDRQGREKEKGNRLPTGNLSPLICIQRPKLIHEIRRLKKPGGTLPSFLNGGT
jgi:hypothetical protein